MPSKKMKVGGQFHQSPLDKFLVEFCPNESRRSIRRLIDQKRVTVNGKFVLKAGYKLKAGDNIEVRIPQKEASGDQNYQHQDLLTLTFHKDGLFAFNKPAGLSSQAGRSTKSEYLESVAKKKWPEFFDDSFFLCHRLDKETTGLILAANKLDVAKYIMDCFRQRKMVKTYLALVWGRPEEAEFTVENFLSPIDKKTGLVQTVRAGGKKAITKFACLFTKKLEGEWISLIACFPRTGRSHQIRVHLAETAKVPIMGDKQYDKLHNKRGADKVTDIVAAHHMLHAFKLSHTQLDQRLIPNLVAPVDQHFLKVLDVINAPYLSLPILEGVV